MSKMAEKKKGKSKEEIEKEILEEAKEEAETEGKKEGKKSKTPSGRKKAEKGKDQSLMEKAQGTIKETKTEPVEPAEIELERVYTIPIKKTKVPDRKRTKRAVKEVKKFVKNHVNADDVVIRQDVNQKIWEKGYKKPPKKVRVKVSRDEEGKAFVSLHK